ncbi:HEAT repeat-containing protein 5B, partial [Exaiptasia diaphana]
SSPHLLLRRASVACLRQLSQREAKEVCEHAMAAGEEGSNQQSSYGVVVGDKGLEGALFSMLDNETDVRMRSDIRYTLTSMLQTLAPHALTHWLGLCRDVLSASKSNKAAAPEQQHETGKENKKDKDDEDEDEEGGMTINEAP